MSFLAGRWELYLYTFSSFFERVDRALRRSLGVSETAKTEVNVEPAPPQAAAPPPNAEEVSMDPNDFIEMKEFKESLNPEMEKTFGSPRVKKEGKGAPVRFDANKLRDLAGGDPEKLERMAEDIAKRMEASKQGEPETAEQPEGIKHEEL